MLSLPPQYANPVAMALEQLVLRGLTDSLPHTFVLQVQSIQGSSLIGKSMGNLKPCYHVRFNLFSPKYGGFLQIGPSLKCEILLHA